MATSASADRGARRWVRGHPWLAAGAATLLLGGVVVVLVWFQPQALLFDTVVDEDFPSVAAADDTDGHDRPDARDADNGADEPEDDTNRDDATEDGADDQDVEPAAPVPVATGAFASRNRYTVTGTATVYELERGQRTLRLEDFESTNGPDLYVYLTAADHADGDEDLDRDVVDLGPLRGNIGDQNYELPADVDLEHHDTVVIWCLRFATSFGAADLTIG